MGINANANETNIESTGTAFSILVSLAFALMPISMYAGWVK
jgi:hypothetical protein